MSVIMDLHMRKRLEQKAALSGVSEDHFRDFVARVSEQVACNRSDSVPAWKQWLVGRMVWDRFFTKEPFPFKEPPNLCTGPYPARMPDGKFSPLVSNTNLEPRGVSGSGGALQAVSQPQTQCVQRLPAKNRFPGKEDQYVSYEKLMEMKAVALGKRREFFVSLQKERDEANRIFGACSRHYRQWHAQLKVWDQLFKSDPFPGKKPIPYEIGWDRAKKDAAIASLTQRTEPLANSGATQNQQLTPASSSNPTTPLALVGSERPETKHSENDRKSTRIPSSISGAISPSKPSSPFPKEQPVLYHGDSYTPHRNFYTSRESVRQGDFYRPEPTKDRQSPLAIASSASSRSRRVSRAVSGWGWGDRHIPSSKDCEYGRLSYDDVPQLGSPVSGVEPSLKRDPQSPSPNREANDVRGDVTNQDSSSIGLKEQPKTTDQGSPEAKIAITNEYKTADVANITVNGKTFFCTASVVDKIINSFTNDPSCSWVASCLNCQFVRQRVSEGNATFYAIPFIKGDEMAEELANKFLENWIQQAIQARPAEDMMSVLGYWKFIHGDEIADDEITIVSSITSQEIMDVDKRQDTEAGRSTSPSYIDELDQLLAEESAKCEGNSRLVLDEESGNLITLGEFKIRVQSRVREHVSQYKPIEVVNQKRAAPEDNGKGDDSTAAIAKTDEDAGTPTKRICIRTRAESETKS